MTDASQGDGAPEAGDRGDEPLDADLTLHLRVGELRADETMQLRVPAPPERPAAEGRAERRRSARPSARERAAAVTGRLLGPLAPYARRFARRARRLKPCYPRPGRVGWRRWIPSWRQWTGATVGSVGLLSLFLVTAYALTDIPSNLNTYATQQDNVYFWSDGTPMARTGWVQRQAMPLKDIPEDVRWAVLAAENESFYSDPGISVKGLSRALYRTVGKGDTEGGSTITQQYVKNVYLNQNQTVSRKFTEAMIALKLDNKMSKDQILEGYLNTSWFGRGSYGIQRAAQAYYGKDVSKLNASEAAMLAGLLKGAGLYDPTLGKANHKRAVERWKWILDRMVKIHRLSPQERARYRAFPEPLKSNPLYNTGAQSDYLVELASQYAKKAGHLTDKQFDLGGYQIYTTFDRKREQALTDAVTKARKQAKRTNPDAAKDGHYGAASVATDGRILAVYGGPDHRTQGYNESNAATVQAGTAFLPFVYAAGLEHGAHRTRGGGGHPRHPGHRLQRRRRHPRHDSRGPVLGPQRQEGHLPQRRREVLRADHPAPGARPVGQHALHAARHGHRPGERAPDRRGVRTAVRQHRPPGARPVARQLHAQRHPHGERLRHVRRRRHAHRAVLGAPDHPQRRAGRPQHPAPPACGRRRGGPGCRRGARRLLPGRPPGHGRRRAGDGRESRYRRQGHRRLVRRHGRLRVDGGRRLPHGPGEVLAGHAGGRRPVRPLVGRHGSRLTPDPQTPTRPFRRLSRACLARSRRQAGVEPPAVAWPPPPPARRS